MKPIYRHTLIYMVLLLVDGCSIWVSDPIDPRLPKYTETGNNVAGALVNGRLWKAALNCELIILCDNGVRFESMQNGSLAVIFDGEMDNEGRAVSFSFNLSSQAFASTADKLFLNDKKFAIDGIFNSVTVNDTHRPCITNGIGQGQIYFKRVALAEDSNAIIYSGTFGFNIPGSSGCESYAVHYGRFDFAVSI
jgi:hypothetical protein